MIYESSCWCRFKRKHVKPISISRTINNVWCDGITYSTFGIIIFRVKYEFYTLFNLYPFFIISIICYDELAVFRNKVFENDLVILLR